MAKYKPMVDELYHYFLASTGVSTDTRTVSNNNLFFALKGEHFDGNQYVDKAISEGALLAVVDDIKLNNHPKCFYVKNVLQALQDLAAHHREQLQTPIIALTGSNGKTTTKELIREVLCSSLSVIATEKNFNNHIGVPLTLLRLKKNTQVGIIEMGANHIGEIAFLCQLAKPDFGLITNIGKAHLEGFGSFEGIVKAKSELYTYLKKNNKKLFLNTDDTLLVSLAKPSSFVGYGTSELSIQINSNNPFITLNWESHIISTQLLGGYNLNNIKAAIAVGQFFDISKKNSIRAIEKYKPNNNRSQHIKKGNLTIFMDAYNANPSSMRVALDHFDQIKSKNKALILGEMRELGAFEKHEHQSLINYIESMRIQKVFLIGESYKKIVTSTKINYFNSTEEAVHYFKENLLHNIDHLLIKGSRNNKLEEIEKIL